MSEEYNYSNMQSDMEEAIRTEEERSAKEEKENRLSHKSKIIRWISVVVYLLAGLIWIINGVTDGIKKYIVFGLLFLVCAVVYLIPIFRAGRKR